MQTIDIKRLLHGGARMQSTTKIKIPKSMMHSRRRLKVHAKRIRAALEEQFPGIEFVQFEVYVYEKRHPRLMIQPTTASLSMMQARLSPNNGDEHD